MTKVQMSETPLQYVARVRYGMGQPPTLADDGEVPIIRATNIQRGHITSPSLQRAHLRDLPLDRAPLLEAGEILVVRSGAYTGDSALITDEWAGSAPGYDLRVTPVSGLDPRFLSWCLLSRYCLDQLDLLKLRAAQPHLNADELASVLVPLPSLEVQRRIADHLDTETARINHATGLNDLRASLVEERLTAELEELIDGPAVPLGYRIQRLEQGTSPVADASPASAGEAGVLKLSAVDRGTFRPSENKALMTLVGEGSLARARKGSVLISRANTPERVGDAAYVDGLAGIRLLFPDLMFQLQVDERRCDARYISMALRTRRVRHQIESTARGSSQSMVKLRQSDVRELRLPLPDRSTQASVATKFEDRRLEARELLDALERSTSLLLERRQALITAAVTGEIEV